MSFPAHGALFAFAFVTTLFGCSAMRRVAAKMRLVDVPNDRSLHKIPVPRLGGVVIVSSVGLTLVLAAMFAPGLARADLGMWLAAGAVVAVLGFVDDVRPLDALPRLLAQLALAAIVASVALRGGAIQLAGGLRANVQPALLIFLATIFVVGTTNIFNFMDGMDGLAATQTLGVGIAFGSACAVAGQVDLAIVAFAIASAAAGFAIHNSPPATIFLGDAGSTFIGFTFASLSLVAAARPTPVPMGVVPIAFAPFLLDGTFTILRRLRAGEQIWQAHRSHLYQRAVGAGLTHRDVLIPYAAWTAAAAAAAAATATGGVGTTCVAGGSMVVALVVVWWWVVRLEERPRERSE